MDTHTYLDDKKIHLMNISSTKIEKQVTLKFM